MNAGATGDGRCALAGVVLAGGASRRMGADKALLEVAGERLVDRVVRRLATICSPVVVASGRRTLAGVAVPQVADPEPDAGPLGGIVAGLDWLAASGPPADLAAVVAVDLPDVSTPLLEVLARLWDGRAPAVLPTVAGEPQPLHALYASAARDQFAALFRAGERSPRRACRRLGGVEVGERVWGPLDPDARFARNLNRPQDVEGWRAT